MATFVKEIRKNGIKVRNGGDSDAITEGILELHPKSNPWDEMVKCRCGQSFIPVGA